MKRFCPRSLLGQMLLAVAIALLLVQGIGAALLYRAQNEMREAGLVHAAAFRLIGEARGGWFARRNDDRPLNLRRGFRGYRIERSDHSPLRADEQHHTNAERRLAAILSNQGIETEAIAITSRRLIDDPVVMARAARRPMAFPGPDDIKERRIMVAGIKLAGESEWLVARVRAPHGEWDLAKPVLVQTLFIYIVLVGAVALILRRITRPLAALTGRVERFAETRSADGQIEPQGPEDIHRLIAAHNAMEARIAALLDEKDVMLGAIGHDLKTPLAALRVRIESVSNEAERVRMATTIEEIVHSLDDILTLARVGRPSDPAERTELSALVASVVEDYEDMEKPVSLGATQRIVLDLRPTWLRRALRNLIDNAVRYGGEARVTLERTNGEALVRVDDNGPGIPDEDIARMMDPFTRGDPSRNTGTGGAGLGLALARAIAEQHGGSLRLANRRRDDGTVEGLSATLALPLT